MSQDKYTNLIDASRNANAIQDDTDKLVESRYSAVIASAKRAREIIEGAQTVLPDGAAGKKPLTIAIEELAKQMITIKRGEDAMDEPVARNTERRSYAYVADLDSEEDEDDESVDSQDSVPLVMHTGSSEDNYNSDSEA